MRSLHNLSTATWFLGPPKNYQPQVPFGEYLQKMYAPFYTNKPEKKTPMQPLNRKLRIRSAEVKDT